jgi:Ca-activated chloride channel family protein
MSVSKQSPFVRACVAFLLALLLSVVVLALALGTHLEGYAGLRFALPWALVGVPLVPVVLWRAIAATEGARPALKLPSIFALTQGPRGWRTRVEPLLPVLRGAALVLGIVAFAGPELVSADRQDDERGIDIAFVLDLSGSMRAVLEDGATEKPQPGMPRYGRRSTRLDVAKEVILDFIGRRKTDRMGVVVFGKAAYVLCPLTLDYGLLSHLVRQMELELIDGNGTAIGDALGTGVARLRKSQAKSKAVVLLTDGDSNAGSLAPEAATDLAKGQGVHVYTVQIGSDDEVDVQDGTDLFGQPRYTRAHFPVNPELLQRIATATGGESFVATDRKALEASMHAILDRLEKTSFQASAARVEELFPRLLLPAVVLVLLDVLLRVLVLRRSP